jgi:YD repeat-containing protein
VVYLDPLRYWVAGISSGPLQLTYGGYDGVGNVATIGDSRPGMGESFAYDALHRLSAADGPYGYAAFAYDAHGNQTGAYGVPNTYEPGTLRLSSRAGVAYAYDSGGNLVAAGGSTFSHTPDNQVASSTVNGTTTTYAYDGAGERVRKDTAGDTTIYLRGVNGQVLTEWRRRGTTSSTRDFVYVGAVLLSTVDRETSADPTACGGKSALAGAPTAVTIAPGQTGATTFEGSACQRVSVRVDVTAGAFGCTWSVIMRKPNGSALSGASATGCNVQTLFVEPVTLPVSGIYTVVVDPAGTSTGSAQVRVWDVVDLAESVTPDGPPVSVPISVPGQVGRYAFDGTAGAGISVQMNATWAMECTWTLTLLHPDGTTLGTAVYCPGTVDFIETKTLPVTGWYTVVVNPKVYYLGTVSLAVRTVVGVTGTIDTVGTPTHISISTAGQTARLRFEGTAGARISLRLDATWAMWCTWKLSLLGPDGAMLGSASACNDMVAFMEPRTLPVTGSYTVLVDPDVYYLGTVMVRAFRVADIAGPIPADGTPLTVATTVPGQNARLTFNATAGQTRGVTLTASWKMGCTWALSLLKPDGSTLAAATACGGTTATITPRTLPVSGTYTVLVDPKVHYSGTVAVAVK